MTSISQGTMVRVEVPTRGGGIPIVTTSVHPRRGVLTYHREKTSSQPGRFLFGTVTGGPFEEFDDQDPEEKDQKFLVQWTGGRHRTSILPAKLLIPAINQEKKR